ncbi:hypothetical protein DFH06DRAFT_653715 [Mycena polygramma]|nr:hypothetical protein DFH06DRAFT_653715 [Mycena polygramma]
MVTVHFSHDLSTVKQLYPPEDYFEEVKAIKRIEDESRIRKALAIKLAQDRDTAAYDDRTIDLLIEKSTEAAPAIREVEPPATPETFAPIEDKAGTHLSDVEATDSDLRKDDEASNDPVDATTEPDEDNTVISPSPKIRGRLARIGARLRNGGKTIARHVARLFCTPCSL